MNSRMIDDIDEFESIALIRFPANIATEIDKEIKAEEDAIKARDNLYRFYEWQCMRSSVICIPDKGSW